MLAHLLNGRWASTPFTPSHKLPTSDTSSMAHLSHILCMQLFAAYHNYVMHSTPRFPCKSTLSQDKFPRFLLANLGSVPYELNKKFGSGGPFPVLNNCRVNFYQNICPEALKIQVKQKSETVTNVPGSAARFCLDLHHELDRRSRGCCRTGVWRRTPPSIAPGCVLLQP